MTITSLPQWTTEITDTIVTGEDMLGVEGAAQGYQQWLIPGIITQTNRARYYSFYAWVLHRFIHAAEGDRLLRNFQGKYFKRHEVAFILGAYGHHIDGVLQRTLVGAGNNYSKVLKWWDASDPISLDIAYFKNSLGGFGQYYLGAMQAMGIVGYSEKPSWVYPLTHRGEALAMAYENSISRTNYFEKLLDEDQLESLSHRDAMNYGEVSCICSEALSNGNDLPLLRESFFRFDQIGDAIDNPHVRRRLALAVTLDLIRGANGTFERRMIRPALYLGEYVPKVVYQAAPELKDWAFRWKMVAVRHQYTFSLQALWASFILKLRQSTGGISLAEFMQWTRKTLGAQSFDAPLSDYLDRLCKDVGLKANWQQTHVNFSNACLQATERDLFLKAEQNSADPDRLLNIGVQLLAQHYLRFLHIHQNPSDEWAEMSGRERLPIATFYEFMARSLDTNSALGQWLETLYREFILGQHEFIALEKLRYQGYDTFKFYFQEGRFYWPFPQVNAWREPVRLAANRLANALSILIDLGLIEENSINKLSVTKDGHQYLARAIESLKHGN
jgi:hypothetical protein